MIKVAATFLFLVTLILNSFFLSQTGGIAIIKFKKLCTCSHSDVLHTEEDHSTDPSKPHFCPRHKTTQKLESHFVVYPFVLVTFAKLFELVYDVLFVLKPSCNKVSSPYPTRLFRPPKVFFSIFFSA